MFFLIAEVVPYLSKDNISQYESMLSKLLPTIERSLASPYEQLRRNSSYCLGMVAFHFKDAIKGEFGTFVEWLSPLCDRENEEIGMSTGADIDNGLGALARILMADHSKNPSLPLNEVLPILLSGLPIESDPEEVETVNTCLCQLLAEREDEVSDFREPIILSIATVFTGDSLSNETTQETAHATLCEVCSQEEMSDICNQLELPEELFS